MKYKTIKIWYWVVTIIFGLFMLYMGAAELMQLESAKLILTQLGYPLYLNYILGAAKILGVIFIFQNKWKTLKEWAFAGFAIDIVGAGASVALSGEGIIASLGMIPFLVVMFASYALWKKL